jgi:hypothetical protein
MEMERCHFWLARFPDRTKLDDYLRETIPYPEDGPISRFAADQHQKFYDHDFVFAEFDEGGDLQAILRLIQAPDPTSATIIASAQQMSFAPNTLFAADEYQFSEPTSVVGDSYQLFYIGCHTLWSRSPAA